MSSIFFFYTSVFFISFFICIPIGPLNLEVLHTAIKKHYPQAVSIAIGGAVADAIWATLAFFGISPFSHSPNMEAAFFVFTALITAGLGIAALKDSRFIEKKEEELVSKIKRKRWALLKGLTLVMVNPLPIVTWMICLQFLRKNGIFIPLRLNFEIFFFLTVTAGVASYFLLIIFITNRMQKIFNPERTRKISKFLGYLLLAFSVYFLYYAAKAFFFNSQVMSGG